MSETTPLTQEHPEEAPRVREDVLARLSATATSGQLPLEKARHSAAWIKNTKWSQRVIDDNGFLPGRTEWVTWTSHDRGEFNSRSHDTGRPETAKSAEIRQTQALDDLRVETAIAEVLFDAAPDHFSNPENTASTIEMTDMVNSVVHNGKRSFISDLVREKLEHQASSLMQLLDGHQDDSQEWSTPDRWELKDWNTAALKNLQQLRWLALISRMSEDVELDQSLLTSISETLKRLPKSWHIKHDASANELRQFANDLLASTTETVELHRIIRAQINETLQPTMDVTGLRRSDLQRLSITSLVGWRDFTDALPRGLQDSGTSLTDTLLDVIDELAFLEAHRQHEESTMKK